MSKIQSDAHRIVSLLSRAEESVAAREISEQLGDITRITVIRRLNELVAHGLVVVEGGGRSTRYRIAKKVPLLVSVPVGFDSWDIAKHVMQPVETRMPVGYQQSLLDAYRPNSTQYLRDPILNNLHSAGRLDIQDSSNLASYQRTHWLQRFLIDVSHASSVLEGVSTDYIQTERLIRLGEGANSSQDRRSVTIILNHKDAIEMLSRGVVLQHGLSETNYNLSTLCDTHAQLTKHLLVDPNSVGQIRGMDVTVAGSSYVPPSDPLQLRDLVMEVLEKCQEIEDPFEQSFFSLVHLSYLQPFLDGNKRTARTVANLSLLRAGYCPISFLGTPADAYMHGVLGVYELGRVELLKDVYVSTYLQSAYYFHRDRERSGEPHCLSLRYRLKIDELLRYLIRERPESPLDAIASWIQELTDLGHRERADLRCIVIEECRNMTEVVARTMAIDSRAFRRWNMQRSTYFNEIDLPRAG